MPSKKVECSCGGKLMKKKRAPHGRPLPPAMKAFQAALMEWNKKKGGKFIIPKKGSAEYDEVKSLLK